MPCILETFKNKRLSHEYKPDGIEEKINKKVFKENKIFEKRLHYMEHKKVPEKTLEKIDITFHDYWIELIDKMIYLFTEMNEEECSKKNELTEKELDKYCNQKKKGSPWNA